ncbi:hypothetical protein POREN0001_1240 [Porphyromonas endodontalis ATCC 35406]|uniref:Uncharacterized protein n=1 Tax=Porphyromonas endodontalis (strain ATCC 35406 / DSM 24491 / JCM 8526 / CCUG 16442 / BCRC 14492 / NCTC 13058 / HG 370) TaxID=553175 RepID=C3J7Z6_POREA|nr:hypothetical protein POREN0001_1240 [Porphyromonas endodontalis ATCC 35406]
MGGFFLSEGDVGIEKAPCAHKVGGQRAYSFSSRSRLRVVG